MANYDKVKQEAQQFFSVFDARTEKIRNNLSIELKEELETEISLLRDSMLNLLNAELRD